MWIANIVMMSLSVGVKLTALVINGSAKLKEKKLLLPVVLVLALCIGGGYIAEATGKYDLVSVIMMVLTLPVCIL